MNTRAKFSYMAFGGVLVFLGMLAAMMLSLTAQKDKIGEIECTKLTVVDPAGKWKVILDINQYGGRVNAWSKEGKSWALSVSVNMAGLLMLWAMMG